MLKFVLLGECFLIRFENLLKLVVFFLDKIGKKIYIYIYIIHLEVCLISIV